MKSANAPCAANQSDASAQGSANPRIIQPHLRQPKTNGHAAAADIEGILKRPATPVKKPAQNAFSRNANSAAKISGNATNSSACARAQNPPQPGAHSPTRSSAAAATPAAFPQR